MRRAFMYLAAVPATAGALMCGCSLGLPDTVDAYGSRPAQQGRPDAPSSFVGTPVATEDAGAVARDAGDADAGPPVVVPPACPPQPLTSFTPHAWIPPTPVHRNACSLQQASMLVDCLMTTVGATQACDMFMTSYQNDTCIQCGLTSVNASRRGPLLDDGMNYYTNPGGCVAALSGDSSASGCGATFDALLQCENAACAKCSDPNFGACADAADQGDCKAYASGLACSAPYSTACIGDSPVDEALKLVKLSCMQ